MPATEVALTQDTLDAQRMSPCSPTRYLGKQYPRSSQFWTTWITTAGALLAATAKAAV
ncbi:MAG: hypothetical protein LC687_02625 [Actinobacteria bacterium]|nr:hypothetical protein [Actinomycetota bacterium]